jgi:hypothetical protein
VRVEPPTFEDALYAAEGLTSDTRQQIQIAASLMQVPVEQAQAEAERVMKERASRPQTVRPRRSAGAVVVERRSPRRSVRELHR